MEFLSTLIYICQGQVVLFSKKELKNFKSKGKNIKSLFGGKLCKQ